MAQDADLLESIARDSGVDYSNWSALLERVLTRLDYIIHNNFPIPSVSFPKPLPPSAIDASLGNKTQPSILQSEIENPLPKALSRRSTASPGPEPLVPDSQPSSFTVLPGTIPPQLLSLFFSIQTTLRRTFSTAPPHTVQRLAELTLRPTQHYRTLPSFLRAVERVISVSSTADTFPLPSKKGTENGSGSSYLSSGDTSIQNAEEFNGATLTRIPWLPETSAMAHSSDRPLKSDLRTESTAVIDGPNGAGSLETVTVSVNGMTKIVRDVSGPGTNLKASTETLEIPHTGRLTRSGTAMMRRDEEEAEDRVQARGPQEIGMEDTGPQATNRAPGEFDIEAALGRPGEGEKIEVLGAGKDKVERDGDGDTLVADAGEKKELTGQGIVDSVIDVHKPA